MGDAPRGFWAAAQADPSRIAVVDSQGRSWTAGELLAAANQLVHGFRARGLVEGDVVASLSRNTPELLALLLAIFQAGWRYVPLNTHLTANEVAYILEDSGARVLVADDAYADVAIAAADVAELADQSRLSVGAIDGFTPLADVVAFQPSTDPDHRVGGQFMQYTSGTTGRPKAVDRALPTFSPEQWIELFSSNMTRYDIHPGGDAVHLVTSPMYHLAPLSFGFFALNFEHTVVLMEHWDPQEALRLIERHRVTYVQMVPTQMHRLMQLSEPVRARYDTSSLRQLTHAAAPCPADLKLRLFDWLGPVIYEFYGATEGGGTMARPEEWLAHPGTVGRPWAGADVKILDDEGNELPPDTIGTVYLKLMGDFAYKGDDSKTAANRFGDYFTVGDVGEIDEEGYLYLRDRKIDMIISGGVNIYPAEVEGALLSHPAVGDAAVFGIPHEDWGEEVKAVVEPNPDYEPDPDLALELIEHCRTSIAGYKCPRSIDFTDAMPRDPNGKLYKRTLRDPYWIGRERSV